jgi:broad specificity phosphatase PhoE
VQSKKDVRHRVGVFWKTEILPMSATDATVLIVTHGGIIGRLREYLEFENYKIRDSARSESDGSWKAELRNCSILEVEMCADGCGEIVRNGDYKHLLKSTVETSRLENSIGED